MQARQERWNDRGKLPHAATIDENLLDCSKGNLTQSKWEDDSNTEHLTGIVKHTQDA